MSFWINQARTYLFYQILVGSEITDEVNLPDLLIRYSQMNKLFCSCVKNDLVLKGEVGSRKLFYVLLDMYVLPSFLEFLRDRSDVIAKGLHEFYRLFKSYSFN